MAQTGPEMLEPSGVECPGRRFAVILLDDDDVPSARIGTSPLHSGCQNGYSVTG